MNVLVAIDDEDRSKVRKVMWIADLVNHQIVERKWRCWRLIEVKRQEHNYLRWQQRNERKWII